MTTSRSVSQAPSERWPQLSPGAIAGGVVVAAVVLFLVWVITRPVTLVNDLDEGVTVTGCVDAPADTAGVVGQHAYDQLVLAAGEQHTMKTPRHACTIYEDNTIIGCLQMAGWPQREDHLSRLTPFDGATAGHWPTDSTQPCADHNYGD